MRVERERKGVCALKRRSHVRAGVRLLTSRSRRRRRRGELSVTSSSEAAAPRGSALSHTHGLLRHWRAAEGRKEGREGLHYHQGDSLSSRPCLSPSPDLHHNTVLN